MATRRFGLSVATALVLGITSAGARAAEEHSDPFEAMQNPKKLLRGALLSEDQVAQIRALRKTQWEQAKALEAAKKAAWDAFDHKFTGTAPVDPKELTELYERGEQLDARIAHSKLEVMIQMRALLSPDQLRRVAETHRQMKNLNAQMQALVPTLASENTP